MSATATANALSMLTGRQKAAILLIALGPEASAPILQQLDEDDIERLTTEILSIKQVSRDQHLAVLEEGYALSLGGRYLQSGGPGYARQMLGEALGAERATAMVTKLVAGVRATPHASCSP